jgi:hypothetical protein
MCFTQSERLQALPLGKYCVDFIRELRGLHAHAPSEPLHRDKKTANIQLFA